VSHEEGLEVRQQWTAVWNAVEAVETAIAAELDLLSEVAAGTCQRGREPVVYQIECAARGIRGELERLQAQVAAIRWGAAPAGCRGDQDHPVLVGQVSQ